jgi:chromosome segregation ATPase
LAQPEVSGSRAQSQPDSEAQSAQTAKKKKVNPFKIQQAKAQIEKLEGQIQLHETRVAVLNQMLASEELYRDHQLFRSTMEEHDNLQKELEGYLAQWENLNAELESLQN